ncbi:unnamed protein product [Paramecium sonneborni]|uniref:TRAFD1/XAF1 zinc finger domain-containing protein n=1 Tax=Paramecium sonneborni TaxID=65129 RepID=A0A8S1NIA1_9CILI|nr:unnamed protein product [Paramecium sonneborni]
MNEITILCSNCRQQIAESKHMLHEIYCLRNNIKCQKCGQFYDKNDPESHEDEYHKKEKCQYCLIEFEDLKKHKCLKKQKQCLHCDLSFPSDQLFQHENQCGSRTQKCDICNNYVMIKEYQTHIMTCIPKPKVEQSQIQKKSTSQEIFDKPYYDKPKIDDRIDQQKFNSKKEMPQQNSQFQAQEKQQVQQQQQIKPQGSGYKYSYAAREGKTQYQLKDEDKNNKQQDAFIRPPSSQNNQTASKNQNQTSTYGSQTKQQTSQTFNQRNQNNTQKEEKTQFDNQYDKQQYINKQQQQIQPQTQQQQKQTPSGQKSLESYSQTQRNQQQSSNYNKKPDLKRPDTAIAREIQKQMELEEQYGISSEEYLQQQLFNQLSFEEKQQQAPPIKKAPPPQPVIPSRNPQNIDNQEFDFENISEEEKLIQQQIMESLKQNQKKR